MEQRLGGLLVSNVILAMLGHSRKRVMVRDGNEACKSGYTGHCRAAVASL